MKKVNKLSALALAIAGLTTAQVTHAITPWQADDSNGSNYGTPDYIIYTSGGAAQDAAYQQVVLNALAKDSTTDVFQDITATSTTNGSRFTGFYFIGAQTLTDPALRGAKIFLEKRSYGAAGYGVVPLLANINLDHLNIFKTATSASAAGWATNTTPSVKVLGVTKTVPTHANTIDTTNWSTYLVSTQSHGGFTGVDAAALLKYPSENYPATVNEYSTNAAAAGFSTKIFKPADLSALTRIPTGGLVYGVGVTLDFYKVLQAAQKLTGTLPSTTTIGAYDQASLPSLSRNFVGALLHGDIQHWSNVLLNVNQSGTQTQIPLTSQTVLTAAGVSAPTSDVVAVGRRNAGAAIGAVAYAKFLNYPYAESAKAPKSATPSNAGAEGNAAPLVKAPGGAAATQDLLLDWQGGSNNSGLNNVAGAKYWGIAVNSADKNTSVTAAGTGGKNWRYVKIDGYAPTIENVASGNYPIWAEGEVLVNPLVGTAHEVSLFTDFGTALSTSSIADDVDGTLVQPWGQTGVFATTVTDSASAIDVPFKASHPIVPFTHKGGDTYTHLGIVPYVYDNGVVPAGPTAGSFVTGSGAAIELQ